jgi:hypothetical protein
VVEAITMALKIMRMSAFWREAAGDGKQYWRSPCAVPAQL